MLNPSSTGGDNTQLITAIQTVAERIRLGEEAMLAFALQLEAHKNAVKAQEEMNKQLAEQLNTRLVEQLAAQHRMRSAIEETRIAAAKLQRETQEQLDEAKKMNSTMQRGMNCLEKLLGLRRFRQVVRANRTDTNTKSTVLDQLRAKTNLQNAKIEVVSSTSYSSRASGTDTPFLFTGNVVV